MLLTNPRDRQRAPLQPGLTPPRPNPTPTPGALTIQQADGQQTSVPRPQPNPMTGQPQLQPPQPDPRAAQSAPSPVAPSSSTPASTTRPTPNPQPATSSSATPPTPNAQPNETRTTDAQGNQTISEPGMRTYIPASQRANVGGYDPNNVPPGWDPRAWRATNVDLRNGANVYHTQTGTPDERVHYGYSEKVGNAAPSMQALLDEMRGAENMTQRQGYLFSNPTAYRTLSALGAIPAVQAGDWDAVNKAIGGRDTGASLQDLLASITGGASGGAPGGPMMASAGGEGGASPSSGYQAMLGQIANGSSYAPITGNERPMSITPNGQPGALEGDLVSEARRQLANPSVYDDKLFQDALGQGKRALDDEFAGRDEALRAELASRGIEYGSIAGTRYAKEAADKGRGYQDMLTNLLRERATSIGGARSAAFNNALAASEYGDTRARNDRAEQRGERAYTDSLNDKARDQSLQEYLLGRDESRYNDQTYQDILRYAMQLGQGGPGVNALGGAGGIYGQGAGRYGEEAAGYNNDIGQLLEMYFRNRTGGPSQ